MGAPQFEQAGADISGTGTTNTIPRWTGPSTLGDSLITQSGNNIGVGEPSPSGRLQVQGLSGNNTITAIGSTTTGQSYGIFVQAGTNASDRSFGVYSTGLSPYLFVRGDGNVGIGTASPLARLHSFISGAAPLVAAGGDTISGSVVEGPNTALASGSGSLQPFAVLTNDTQAVDRGGGILFGGKWTNANNSFAYFGGVKAGKENSTSAEYGGYLAFYSRTNGATGLAERARIDSAGNFGIANSAPGNFGAGARNLVVGDTALGSTGLSVISGSASYGTINFGRGTGGLAARGWVQYEHSTDKLFLGASGATNVAVTSTLLDASIVSGYGLKLQGTGGTNNTDPNVLDFYADGGTANSGGVTWTPTLKFGGSTTGITYSTRVGRYTRIGNMVFASGYIILSSKGTAVGNATIDGLPAASSLADLYSAASISYLVNVTFASQPVGYIGPGATWLNLTQNVSGGASSSLTNAEFSNTSAIIFSIAYSVN